MKARHSSKIALATFTLSLYLCLLADTTSASWHVPIKSVAEILSLNKEITYTPCHTAMPFKHTPLPLADNHYLHPYSGTFEETFILTIPQGAVYGRDGWILVDNHLIHELIWQNVLLSRDAVCQAEQRNPLKVSGRVAVIVQSGYGYYYHWMIEVLGRLALLEWRRSI